MPIAQLNETTLMTAPSNSTNDAEMNGKRPMLSDSDEDEDEEDSEDELTFTERMDVDEEMEDASGTPMNQNVNVEFVFTDPREQHFHSVKQFLLSYLPSSQPFDVSGFANLIVGQRAAGTMVSVEGEDDVYGFITALSIPRYTIQEPHTSMQQIVQYLLKKCGVVDKMETQRLETFLSTKNVGLIVNERMINLPYQLIPPLHSALHQDVEWAIEHEATVALRESFQFDYFLLICSCTMEKSGSQSSGTGKKKNKTEYSQVSKYFINFEEEFLETEAEVSITFELPTQEMSRKYTTVLLIERNRHKGALDTIAAMING